MIGPFTAEVALSCLYATLLLAIAAGLDQLARHVQSRSDRLRTTGFTYEPQHDAWVCPTGQTLWPQGADHERHLVRYRAKPAVCNKCPVKHRCTSSDHGREIVRATAPWPHSESGRFHRGLALVPVAVAATLLLIQTFTERPAADLGLIGLTGVATIAVCWWLTAHLRASPSNFPAANPPARHHTANPYATRWGIKQTGRKRTR